MMHVADEDGQIKALVSDAVMSKIIDGGYAVERLHGDDGFKRRLVVVTETCYAEVEGGFGIDIRLYFNVGDYFY